MQKKKKQVDDMYFSNNSFIKVLAESNFIFFSWCNLRNCKVINLKIFLSFEQQWAYVKVICFLNNLAHLQFIYNRTNLFKYVSESP